jgi:sulfite exporter TauE/SafE
MCGAFFPDINKIPFNFGRLISYLLQWALIHFAGLALESYLPWLGLSFRLYAFALIVLVYMISIQSWRGQKVSFPGRSFFQKRISFFSKNENSLLHGFLLGFRGCGWLWAFLLALASLADSQKSFALVCLFWLTTWPGLHLGHWILRRWPSQSIRTQPHKSRAVALASIASVQLLLWLGVWTLPDFSSEKAFQGLWAPSSATKSAETPNLAPLQVLCHGQLRK